MKSAAADSVADCVADWWQTDGRLWQTVTFSDEKDCGSPSIVKTKENRMAAAWQTGGRLLRTVISGARSTGASNSIMKANWNKQAGTLMKNEWDVCGKPWPNVGGLWQRGVPLVGNCKHGDEKGPKPSIL